MTAALVFITGASSGIGQALAARYAQAGWRLALVARRTGDVEAWAGAQNLARERWEVYAADVQDIDSIVAAGWRCIERQGLPDVVIANAGISVGIDTALVPLPPPVLGGTTGVRLSRSSVLWSVHRCADNPIQVGRASAVGIHTLME